MQATKNTTPNRLIHETSTYLLQHAYNPVDWYGWGEEALNRARTEEKPILLSIGYAACHWCHVMEHESFEDAETAKLMNECFVNIKVDREERTDLDEIYMKAVQMMTGHGGWPMTVFLTPELKPFFGGTYFPPQDRHGLPGFKKLLLGIHDAWTNQRDEVLNSSEELTSHLRQLDELEKPSSEQALSYGQIELAVDKLLKIFDRQWGGFGHAPKFPHTFSLSVAMRYAAVNAPSSKSAKQEALEIVTTTLDRMAYGGMHDQIGGGFARYSVDRQWLIPHFEKMLYDNALLCQTYLEGFVLTGREYWRQVAAGILQFVLRELTTEDGAFYSSLDADSEGEEGKFYAWDEEEIKAVLGSDSTWFNEVFGVTRQGNFEHGHSVLHLTKSPEELAAKHQLTIDQFWSKVHGLSEKLMTERDKRIRPGRDEKVLTSWNSLMICAFVDGYKVIREPRYLSCAIKAANFILDNLVVQGRLLRTWGKGKSKLNAYVDDYAYFAQALLDLASVDSDPRWMQQAEHFTKVMLEQFWDEENHGFFYTSNDHEKLVSRPKSYYDGAIPSGSSVASMVLLRLARLTDNKSYAQYAENILRLYSPYMARVPDQFSNFLCAVDFSLAPPLEVAVIAPTSDTSDDQETTRKLLYEIFAHYVPNKVVITGSGAKNESLSASVLLKDRTAIGSQPTVYICKNYTCDEPLTDPLKLAKKMDELAN